MPFLNNTHHNAFCKHMAAVATARDDGTLDAFPSEDEDTEPEDATATVSGTSRVGRAFVRIAKNCRTNHHYTFLYP
ncbi:hypothetical protein [Haladaptatus sp. CMAA 1911]|uniref:hypothetical protein n=1 Tax=Haladaptatus sp. CMAA 1911 TaxID=3368987 RepID=UPI0037553E4B